MQLDKAGDLHPCAYCSKTFSSAKRNYDIYDQELLAVILALVEWKQYLQGTSHPVSILTDHKNISYLKDPRKLSRWQAHWSLFLQDFDLVWKVTPGTHMGPTDSLSQRDHLDTTGDNADTPILPDPMVINSLDLTLACHIKSSSASDPFVLKALAALDEGSPLFTWASLSDWSFDNGRLYFRNRMFVPPSARSALLHSICYVFFSPRSSDLPSSLPTGLPRTPPHIAVLVSSSPPPPSPPLAPVLVLHSPHLHLSPFLYFLRHPQTPNPLGSMDLPWISPGSPPRLTDTHLRVLPFSCFPCFTFVSAPLLLSHLILLLSLIPCITIKLLFTLTHRHFVIVFFLTH